jgi:hypothetical protein
MLCPVHKNQDRLREHVRRQMSRLTQRESFAPTQPLPEYQELLRKQRRWSRPEHTPNYVPLGLRLIYSLVSVTWLSWAMIGLLSGHMFFLVSRKGPIHFTGIPALMFSGAVLASAAACAIAIVDHYDRRDNEDAYKRFRRWLWWSAAGLFLIACIIGFAERADVLPYSDGRVGLLSTASLKSLLLSKWLANKLGPHKSTLDTWALLSGIWCFAGLLIMAKLGFIKEGDPPRPGAVFVMFAFFVLPALSLFTLYLIYALAAGDLPSRAPLSEEELRSQLAWMQSMLVTCLAALSFSLLALVSISLRAIGVIPPLSSKRSDAV